MKRLTLALITVVSMSLGGTAAAANAYTQGIVHLRAGPSTDYPIVASIPPSSLLAVNGCLDDYTWCDADWEGNHGWVYGDYLYYDYQDRRVPVLQFGAALGIGIVPFSVADYWGRYYVGRPWYGRRDYWMHRRPPPRRPPPRPSPPRPPVVPPRPPAPPPRPHPSRPQPPRPQPPATGRPNPNPDGGNRPGPSRPGGGNQPGSGGRPGGGPGTPPQTRPTPPPDRNPGGS